jgi:hypothetical protein
VSRDSSVDIATRLRAGRRGVGVGFPVVAREFSLLHNVQTGSRAQLASYTMGIGSCSPGAKRLGRETDHSPPSSAEVTTGEAVPLRLQGAVLN